MNKKEQSSLKEQITVLRTLRKALAAGLSEEELQGLSGALKEQADQLERLSETLAEALEAMPENLQFGPKGEAAEEEIAILEDGRDLLSEVLSFWEAPGEEDACKDADARRAYWREAAEVLGEAIDLLSDLTA